jgi:hypothetical protein
MHQTQSFFGMKNLQDAGMDNVFFWMNPVARMYTMFFAVLRRQRKSDFMTSFGLSADTASIMKQVHR